MFNSPASGNVCDVVACVFGKKQSDSIMPIVKSSDDGNLPFTFSGFISQLDECRSAPDRQFLAINQRPVDYSRVNKIVNQFYHLKHKNRYPFILLNITLTDDHFDVNVTPDKRTVFLDCEQEMLEELRKILEQMLPDAYCQTITDTQSFSRSVGDSFLICFYFLQSRTQSHRFHR